jgi:ABC-2 type transport system ATP-binding protein
MPAMPATPATPATHATLATHATPAIAARGVAKVYPNGVAALCGLDLEMEEGELFCLIGPNGAGKTTLMRILGTQLAPSAGQISIFGWDLATELRRVRGAIAVVPQGCRPDPYLRVWEHVYYYLVARGAARRAARAHTEEALAGLGLTAKRDALVGSLSGGMSRRVLLAMALASRSRLLLLDEPTVGLDLLARRETWKLLAALKNESKTILVTTHSMEEAEALADRVGIVDRGRMVALGTAGELRRQAPGRQKVVIAENAVPLGLLEGLGRVEFYAGKWAVFVDHEADLRHLLDLMVERRVEAAVLDSTLEDVFVHLVGGGQRIGLGELH